MTSLHTAVATPEGVADGVLRDTAGRPLRDLRISVTDRCNFRCVYCMPKEVFGKDYAFLERKELLTFEEIARLARVFRGLGIEKVRLTGGEPLVRRNIEELVAMLAAHSRPGPHAHHQRILAREESRRAAQGRSETRDGEPRRARRRDFQGDERRGFSRRARARRDRRRRGGGARPDQGQHGRQARAERARHPADGTLLPRAADTSCASSNTWMSAPPTAGAWTTS